MMEVTTSPRLPDEAGGHGPWSRVIVHFDLDCFYAQVRTYARAFFSHTCLLVRMYVSALIFVITDKVLSCRFVG